MIQAVHTAVKGRARYKISGLYGSASLKRYLESRLAEHDGIQAVSASTLTGNVLVLFRPETQSEVVASLLARVVAECHNAADHSTPQGRAETDGAAAAPPLSEAGAPYASRRAVRQAVIHAEAQRDASWHGMEADEVTAALDTSQTAGLSSASAHERLETYGPNLSPEAVPRSSLSILLEQFTSLPVALLGVAAGLSLLTGGVADALVIAGVVALNATIGYVTESQAEQTIHSLQSLVRPSTVVLRTGRLSPVKADSSTLRRCAAQSLASAVT